MQSAKLRAASVTLMKFSFIKSDYQILCRVSTEFHDAISSWKPELCRMDSSGSFAFDRQPASSFVRPPSTKEVPNQENESPTSVETSAIASAIKHVDLTTQEVAAKTYTSAELDAALSKAVRPLLTKITKLEQDYEEIASSPDPKRSAYRSVTGMQMPKIAVPDAKKAQRKAARKAKRDDKIADFRELAASGDPDIRIHALTRLRKMGVDA